MDVAKDSAQAQSPLEYTPVLQDTLDVLKSDETNYQLGSYLHNNNKRSFDLTDYDKVVSENYALYQAGQGSYKADKAKANSLKFAQQLAEQKRISEDQIVPFAFANFKKAVSDVNYINGVPSLDGDTYAKLVSNPNVTPLTMAKISNGLNMIAGDRRALDNFGLIRSTFKKTNAIY